ncbi:hypothetical protein J2753_001097 [Halolamina salifodinae]|uniref:Uncharacterized protein n=1 Tax=Halolamina salifodinae TaxID=1202767 RepID=A0A8T4GX13_9EURY|nr:hypothetical protein [Halolamina salifodinae]
MGWKNRFVQDTEASTYRLTHATISAAGQLLE